MTNEDERLFKLGFLDGVRDEAEALGYCHQSRSVPYKAGYEEGRAHFAAAIVRFRNGLAPTVPAPVSPLNEDGSPKTLR